MAAPKGNKYGKGKATGRPSSFTEEKADEICNRLMDGESLRTICKDDHLPNKGTVMRWLGENQAFCDQYARAREIQAEYYAQEITDIADDQSNDWVETFDNEGNSTGSKLNHEHVQRSKLRVDARKWVAAKLLPKKYGDKIGVGGADDLPPIETKDQTDTEVAKRIAFMLAKGMSKPEE